MGSATETASAQIPEIMTECMRQSVLSTFSQICGVDVTCKDEPKDIDGFDGLVGVISLVGDGTWALLLGLPRETAISMSKKFAGFEVPYESEDMGDVVGELVNVLAGDLAARFDEVGVKVNLSLPSVARGAKIEMLLPMRVPAVRLHFESPEGPFWTTLGASDGVVPP